MSLIQVLALGFLLVAFFLMCFERTVGALALGGLAIYIIHQFA